MPKLKPTPKAMKTQPDPVKTMTVKQVEKALGISRSMAYATVRSEGFPKIRLGKRLLVPKEAFEEWMKQNTILTYDSQGR